MENVVGLITAADPPPSFPIPAAEPGLQAGDTILAQTRCSNPRSCGPEMSSEYAEPQRQDWHTPWPGRSWDYWDHRSLEQCISMLEL